MIGDSPAARSFVLPQLKIERIETALTEPRYMVTLVGQGRRLMIAPKLADLILQLQQGKSLKEAAVALSELWQREISGENLRQIIEQQMVRQGLALPAGESFEQRNENAREIARANRKPLYERLLTGHFSKRLLKGVHVKKICAPLTFMYEPFSVLLALVFIVASRWVFYSSLDSAFLRQALMQFSAVEYLSNLGLLLLVIFIHEFGHASAQLKYGVPTGGIGLQLYYYIPAFFTNVSSSWALKPIRRVIVDAGGIYFQSLAASVLAIIYLRTGSLAFLTAVVVSDVLCLVSINPFLRFDGYWLLSDALAVPNLQKASTAALKHLFKRLTGKGGSTNAPLLGNWRMAVIAVYAILKNCFWVLLVVGVLLRGRAVLMVTASTFSKFLSQSLEGLKTADPLLVVASIVQMFLFGLMLLALSVMVGKLIWKFYGLGRDALSKLFLRQRPEIVAGEGTSV